MGRLPACVMQHASRLAEGVAGYVEAGNRMRTKAGKMPESLIFPIRNGHGVSNDRFGFKDIQTESSFCLQSSKHPTSFP